MEQFIASSNKFPTDIKKFKNILKQNLYAQIYKDYASAYLYDKTHESHALSLSVLLLNKYWKG